MASLVVQHLLCKTLMHRILDNLPVAIPQIRDDGGTPSKRYERGFTVGRFEVHLLLLLPSKTCLVVPVITMLLSGSLPYRAVTCRTLCSCVVVVHHVFLHFNES